MGTTRTALVTGGAGFVGCNLIERLLTNPDTRVRLFDNFSRAGVLHNLDWLRAAPFKNRLEIVEGDVRDQAAVRRAAEDVQEIYHLAAQVAVTTSIQDPLIDFDVNARGTLNVLEAARTSGNNPFVLFTSTNKVYGSLSGVPVSIRGSRYLPQNANFAGVSETEPLDFHSPYGCSKGAADQYVRDYARIYRLPTVVFRMSCIAGPHQFGNEDQGWVAHFLYKAMLGEAVTVYGNGYQVRDVLHVHDLTDAILAARSDQERTQGRVFNLGGGSKRSISVIDMLRMIEAQTGRTFNIRHREARPGDQPFYISDTSAFEEATGWTPRRSLSDTLSEILAFWRQNTESISVASTHDLAQVELQEEVA